ncbi:hypothetical protein ma430 [Moumouvirus australiensis]|uniref:Ankyrin repeat protein n=1 Tax=Moumouvirus australiensis TaxID=2109587 RepID=A0A2P1ELP0_9VIRU|nr:hypothetical protein QKC55_gp475 [Moumouvirus australiensis]AVL94816.1 hypothetical protein ma430 [Moumouvirus australiensis]
MSSILYFKITNENENTLINFNGKNEIYNYVNGLNFFKIDGEDSIDPVMRFNFYEHTEIMKALSNGLYLREILIPVDQIYLKIDFDSTKKRYFSNMIFLGKKYDFRDLDTWKY